MDWKRWHGYEKTDKTMLVTVLMKIAATIDTEDQ
jgi:hypothetical protein